MPTTPSLAQPDDVRLELDTDLDDDDLTKIIARVTRAIERAYVDEEADDDGEPPFPDIDDVFHDDDHRIEFEAVVAAHRIATGRDRQARVEAGDTFRVEYEANAAAALAARVADLDPGEAFRPTGQTIHHDATGRIVEQDRADHHTPP